MADGYNIGNTIETKQDRRKAFLDNVVNAVKGVVGESLAAAPGQIMETMKQKWDQGRDELAKVINHGADGYMPWPDHQAQDAPAVEAPQQEQAAVIEPPARHRPQAEAASQAASVSGYMNGYKPPVRTDYTSLHQGQNSQSQSL